MDATAPGNALKILKLKGPYEEKRKKNTIRTGTFAFDDTRGVRPGFAQIRESKYWNCPQQVVFLDPCCRSIWNGKTGALNQRELRQPAGLGGRRL